MTNDAKKADETSRSIVVICLDSVRKDFFEKYAHRIRAEADINYGQCRAASSWSTPSHASMLTGKLPHIHGVHTYTRDFNELELTDTFLSSLPDHNKIGISANAWASSDFGFDLFFDDFYEVHALCRYPNGLDMRKQISQSNDKKLSKYTHILSRCIKHENSMKSLANGILSQVDSISRDLPIPKLLDDGTKSILRTAKQEISKTEGPYFIFMSIMDPHIGLYSTWGYDSSLYSVPDTWSSDEYSVWELIESDAANPDYWKQRRQLYRAVIDYVDRQVDQFVKDVRRTSDTDVSFIVTSDHGDNLGTATDEFLANHKSSLSEGLLHVPLQIIDPPVDFETRTDGYASHLDLGEIVTSLAHEESLDPTVERISAELIGLSAGPEPSGNYDYWDRMQRCAYEGETKYVWDSRGNSREFELDWESSCWQRERSKNSTIPDWSYDMFDVKIKEYKGNAKRSSTKKHLDPGTAKRLKDLGYL